MAIKKIIAPSIGPNVFTNQTIIEQIITSSNDNTINTIDLDVADIITDSSITAAKINSLPFTKVTGTATIDQLPQMNIASDKFLKGDGTWSIVPTGVSFSSATATDLSATSNGGGNTGTDSSTISTPSSSGLVMITYNITKAKATNEGTNLGLTISGSGLTRVIENGTTSSFMLAGNQVLPGLPVYSFIIGTYTASGTITFSISIGGGGPKGDNGFNISAINATFIN